jgi:transcriptional regulator with GAF, ATPase, and Fis domain
MTSKEGIQRRVFALLPAQNRGWVEEMNKRSFDGIDEERKVISTHVDKFREMQRKRLAQVMAESNEIMEQVAAALRIDKAAGMKAHKTLSGPMAALLAA